METDCLFEKEIHSVIRLLGRGMENKQPSRPLSHGLTFQPGEPEHLREMTNSKSSSGETQEKPRKAHHVRKQGP